MGGEWGWCAPFGSDRDYRLRFTSMLARADIAAVQAIREDFSDARMVHIDPLIWVVPPRDRPDLAEPAHSERSARHLPLLVLQLANLHYRMMRATIFGSLAYPVPSISALRAFRV
jgi:hypothetical protein